LNGVARSSPDRRNGDHCGWLYNFLFGMQNPRYALVAYVNSPAGEFVENLRRELHPGLSQIAAHLTILPPRQLQGTESSALELLNRICGQEEPFSVTLGCVETFMPVTPTVFIRIESEGPRMSALHQKLNVDMLEFQEEWPYIPHLTVVKMSADQPAKAALETARRRWEGYHGTRRILLEKLTFVREEAPNCWVDLAPVVLGRSLVSR
jgi:2'-5' RNA ligase